MADAATIPTPPADPPPVRPLSGYVLSLGFWGCLVGAAALFTGVSLAPRVVEREALRRERADRQSELLTLQQETSHLAKVAEGLVSDARLVASVARQELEQPQSGMRAVPLTGRLRHDPRDQAPDPVDVGYEEPVYLPVLQFVARSPARRLRWSLLAAGLLTFGFVFLHENAGSRAVARLVAAPFQWLSRRYARTPHRFS